MSQLETIREQFARVLARGEQAVLRADATGALAAAEELEALSGALRPEDWSPHELSYLSRRLKAFMAACTFGLRMLEDAIYGPEADTRRGGYRHGGKEAELSDGPRLTRTYG